MLVICRVDCTVQALAVIAVPHRRGHDDLVLAREAGQRDPLTVEAGQVDIHAVERDPVELPWLDVQERGGAGINAPKTHGAGGLKGLGAQIEIELDAVSADVDEG